MSEEHNPGQEQHLPHEAWHVVQQKQGRVKPTGQDEWHIVQGSEGEQHLPHEAWHVVQKTKGNDGAEVWTMQNSEEKHLPHESWHVVQEKGKHKVVSREKKG
jgi:hypothetical protein